MVAHKRRVTEANGVRETFAELKNSFLDPAETRRRELCALIEQALSSVPRGIDPLDPFIGQPEPNHRELLQHFEDIPEYSRPTHEVFKGLAIALQGQLRWHNPRVMHNINPPPMLEAVAAAALANLYNPNPLWDFVSGGSHELEKQIVRQFSGLIDWDSNADGVFTFGGKGCLTYALRIGLNRALRGVSTAGLAGKAAPVVIASETCHYSIETAACLLGIGRDNCIWVPSDPDERINFEAFCRAVDETLSAGRPIAAVVACGGNTLSLAIDPIRRMAEYLDSAVTRFGLIYRPYLHFDCVSGWPWLFFRGYDFRANPMRIDPQIIEPLEKAALRMSEGTMADSIGIDFHKDGFTPYLSSLFVVRRGAELHSIFKDEVEELPRREFGNNFLQHHMIEHSRSAAPIFSAWVALQRAGVSGMRSYVAELVRFSCTLRSSLGARGFHFLNSHSLGFCGVFWPVPPHGPRAPELAADLGPEELRRINTYTFDLFRYIGGFKRDFGPKIVLGFLPQYVRLPGNRWLAALRMYPMAMAIDDGVAADTVEILDSLKREFDRDVHGGDGAVMPTHVPK